MEFETELEVNGDPIEVRVEYRYRGATPDVMYLANGDPGYPGDPAECEVLGVFRTEDTKGEKDLMGVMTPEQLKSIEEQAFERGAGGDDDDYDPPDRDEDY